MKKVSMWMLLAVVGVAASSFVWADHHEGEHKHAGWFDAAACDVCKPWTENAKLMMSTKWETHTIKNGMLMVSTVPADQLESFNEVCKKMDDTMSEIKAGKKQAGLCGFCEAMGGLMEAGAKTEKVDTAFGNITLITSNNPQTVTKIHEVAKRSQEEAKKMLAAMKK